MLVSVIILNWNNEDIICECIGAVLKQNYADIELFVVDNKSEDGSGEKIKNEFPNVKLIENSSNLGFCKANNEVISKSKGEFVLLLNADVIISSNFISEMLKAARSNEKIGSVSAKLLKLGEGGEKTDIIDSAGHLLTKSFCPFNRGQGEKDVGQYSESDFVFGATAAAVLYRKKMLDDIKIHGEYFDELFFAFYEDTDIDWRAQLLGWKCLYDPKAVAHHYRGGSVKAAEKKEIHKIYFRNRYLMIIKNASVDLIIRNFFHIIVFELAAIIEVIFAPYLVFSCIEVLKMLPIVLKKRKIIMNNVKVDNNYISGFLVNIDFKKRLKNRLNYYKKIVCNKG